MAIKYLQLFARTMMQKTVDKYYKDAIITVL